MDRTLYWGINMQHFYHEVNLKNIDTINIGRSQIQKKKKKRKEKAFFYETPLRKKLMKIKILGSTTKI